MADIGTYNMDFTSLAAAGMQMLGNAVNSYLVADTHTKDREFAQKMYQLQHEDAIKDWEMVNEYNKPENFMKRLADAGINPILAFGGNITSSAELPHKSDVPLQYSQAPQLNMDFLAASDLMSKIKLNESQAKKNNAEADKAESETTGQNLANDFAQATMDIRIALESNRNYEVMTNIRKMDADIRNQSFLTDSQIRLNNEQIDSIIQARYVQWQELELTKSQIGAQIRQGYMHAEAALKSASAAELNAAGNYLKASSDALRNSKLNELTDYQIGSMALEYKRMSIDMQYDAARHEQEEFKRQEYQKTRDNWNKNFGWSGMSFDDFRSLIPFAPSVEHSSKNVSTGESVKWKF